MTAFTLDKVAFEKHLRGKNKVREAMIESSGAEKLYKHKRSASAPFEVQLDPVAAVPSSHVHTGTIPPPHVQHAWLAVKPPVPTLVPAFRQPQLSFAAYAVQMLF